MMQSWILRVDCRDRAGIVAAVAQTLAQTGFTIEESAQFNDTLSGHFFMRVVFRGASESADQAAFARAFQPVAQGFAMEWSLHPQGEAVPALILVSKADHCLHDLLGRVKTGRLPLAIRAIVSNHEDLRDLAEMYGCRFIHNPVSARNKPQTEAQLRAIMTETGSELVVLARYMQILSADFCADHPGRIINIHHSFLPGFKGARPYAQAHARGVKLIGATAHFVTADLDEGPIIEQMTQRISHRDDPTRMMNIGKDIESLTLARALAYYAERRIFLHGQHTVIL